MRFRTSEDTACATTDGKHARNREFVVVVGFGVLFGFKVETILLVFELLQLFVVLILSNPRLAYLTCDWYNRYGSVLFSQTANGLLGPAGTNGSYFVTTVQAGVLNTSWTGSPLEANTCTIQFPGGASLYAGGFSTMTTGSSLSGSVSPVTIPNMNIDFAEVVIPSNGYLASYAGANNYCSSRPAVGDSIALLGYSSAGANTIENTTQYGSITSTSGYYDMTNISVPNGMQGATAVSLVNGCTIGQINSSGEIADITQLRYSFGW